MHKLNLEHKNIFVANRNCSWETHFQKHRKLVLGYKMLFAGYRSFSLIKIQKHHQY